MIKKFYIRVVLVTMFFVSGSLFNLTPVFADTNFGIGAIIGLGYAPNSQMNDAVAGYGDAAAAALNAVNSTTVFKGTKENAGFAYGFDLDTRLLVDSFGFGCTIGYQGGGTSSSTAEASGYQSKQSLTFYLSSVSYLATLYYRHIIDETSFLLIGAGPGYYKGTMKLTEEAKGFISGNFKDEYSYGGSTWGGHVKAEYNVLLGSIDLFGGVMGRYAKISEFKKGGIALTSSGKKLEGNFTGALVYFGAGLMF